MTLPNNKKGKLDNAPTANDVAKIAEVSRWTVSRAFRNNSSISKATYDRVMAAAKQLGYTPNLVASSLATSKTGLVALLIDDFTNPHKLVMLQELSQALKSKGFDTLLLNTIDPEKTSEALASVRQRQVDATVLVGSQFNDDELLLAAESKAFKKLVVFARRSEHPNTISVCVDDVTAMNTIYRYIRKKGYLNPLFLAGPQTLTAHLKRKETFLDLWLNATGSLPASIDVGSYDPQLAYNAMLHYFETTSHDQFPDIIVCENDALAIGATDALRYELEMSIPEDIAIVGFDDVPLASSKAYSLTSYKQPIREMSVAVAEVLSSEVNQKQLHSFTGEIVIRQSG